MKTQTKNCKKKSVSGFLGPGLTLFFIASCIGWGVFSTNGYVETPSVLEELSITAEDQDIYLVSGQAEMDFQDEAEYLEALKQAQEEATRNGQIWVTPDWRREDQDRYRKPRPEDWDTEEQRKIAVRNNPSLAVYIFYRSVVVRAARNGEKWAIELLAQIEVSAPDSQYRQNERLLRIKEKNPWAFIVQGRIVIPEVSSRIMRTVQEYTLQKFRGRMGGRAAYGENPNVPYTYELTSRGVRVDVSDPERLYEVLNSAYSVLFDCVVERVSGQNAFLVTPRWIQFIDAQWLDDIQLINHF